MSKFEKVKSYYDAGLWNIERVKMAVTSNPPWITADEFEQITEQPYTPVEE